jgi:hypothetical protein
VTCFLSYVENRSRYKIEYTIHKCIYMMFSNIETVTGEGGGKEEKNDRK